MPRVLRENTVINRKYIQKKIVFSSFCLALVMISLIALIFNYFNIVSNDEKEYLNAMRGGGLERHPGFWVPAILFYRFLGPLGVRLYNILLYLLSSIIIYKYMTKHRTLIPFVIFSLNPFILYFIPHILSEPSGYLFTVLALTLMKFSPLLSGLSYGLAFSSKYYTIILLPLFMYIIYKNTRLKGFLLFIVGASIPVILMFLAGYLYSGNILAFFSHAGPEILVPLNKRSHIPESIILVSISPFIVSVPFTTHIIKIIRNNKDAIIGFILIYISNFILGFLHLTGMTVWRYRDHLRLVTVIIPVYSYFASASSEDVGLAVLVIEIVLSYILLIGFVLLRLISYGIVNI